ncbi:MAG: helix-turn-helix transcriptional regulator [Pseudomonadota bacterium]|nr:XRE family transcriptional regulator [Pseudomonadota bacterium]QKK05119.1 MAG: helix-turn-helix transcriptional regulator [Pseudomonadota bacterium]
MQKTTRSPDEIDTHIGKNIRKFRQLAELTQRHLAAELDMTYQQVQKYEAGRSRIAAVNLYKLSRMFGVTVDCFFNGYEDS